ncbi:bacterial extracellular solute-binding family protein, partial [Vibrio cholerae CP1035(8)]
MKKTWITTALLATFVSLPTAIYAQDIQPEPDSDLLIWTDTTTLDYMKYAAESFNQDFGYKVKFSFRGLAPIDAASRMIQDGGSARVADIAEIEHDLLGKLVVAGGAMENLVSAEHIQSTFLP